MKTEELLKRKDAQMTIGDNLRHKLGFHFGTDIFRDKADNVSRRAWNLYGLFMWHLRTEHDMSYQDIADFCGDSYDRVREILRQFEEERGEHPIQ